MTPNSTMAQGLGLELWKSLRSGLIVSCQASAGTAMDRPDFISAQANTVEQAGAIAIRAEGVENVRAVLASVHVPVIGLIKDRTAQSEVFITPTADHVVALAELGTHIIAVDATSRARWNGQGLKDFFQEVRERTDAQIMADIDSLANAEQAIDLGFDAVATTLSGYTKESQGPLPDILLVKKIAQITDKPLVAEGGYSTPAEVRAALDAGAWSVCVGTAITNPFLLTQKWIAEI